MALLHVFKNMSIFALKLNNKMCKKTGPDAITIFVILFSIVTTVAEIVILSKIDSFSANQIGLSFIGIVATFVVISNFAYVVETRNKVKEDLEKMEGKVERIAGLEEYYDYFIRQEIADLLYKCNVNGAFRINPSSMKIVHAENLTFFVRIRIPKRNDGVINMDETEHHYFVVWLDKKDGKELTKEQFDEREAL